MGIQINGQTDTISAVDGSITVATDLTVPGALTYDDVTNIDSVGIITARDGLNVTGGRVLIGTTTEGEQGADDLTIATNSTTGMTIRSGTSNAGNIYFSDGVSGSAEYRGYISYMHNEDSFAIGANGNEKVRITSAGSVGIASAIPSSEFKLDVNGDLSLGEASGTDNTYIDQKQNGQLNIINSGRQANSGSVRINKTNSISGDTTYFRDFEVYDGKDKLLFLIDGSEGRIGVGTDNLSSNLTIAEDHVSTNAELAINYTGSGNRTSAIRFQRGGTNYGYIAGAGFMLTTGAQDDLAIAPVSGKNLLFGIGNSEKLRITAAGNIGIGENNPIGNLEVNGNDGINISNATRTGTNGAQWRLIPHNGGGSATNLRLYEGAGATEVINITKTGRIGVNRMTPSFMLDIVGNSSTGANCIRIVDGAENGHGSHPAKIVAGGTYYQEMQMHSRRFAVHTYDGSNIAERFRVHQNGNIGINCTDPGSLLELNAAAGSKMGISLGAVGDNITASRYIGICKTADQTDIGANSGFSGIEFGGPYSTNEGYLAFHTHDLGVESGERIRLTKDGKFGVGLTAPESKVQIRNTTTYGKDTYASANTGGSQTPPPGTFKWDNVTPVAGHGRGYKAHVQSGDAYPNASNYIDVLIRNGSFYRITLKRSHSSAEAAVCQMMVYGLANSSNSNYPVVHMNGASGSGTNHSTVQRGGGRGSSNAVASFYWEIHSYNINTHDTIIRITTTGSNNQGIVALIEEI